MELGNRLSAWARVRAVAQQVTGRRVVGTTGGLYAFEAAELFLPEGDVEGVVHELCHFVVATESERRQLNYGLSTDWQHPDFVRMVRREEAAWSLELWLWGDPSAREMVRYMTPESIASGGGGYTWTAAELERFRLEEELRVKCKAQEILLRAVGVEPLCACGHTFEQHFWSYSCTGRCECKLIRLQQVPAVTESAQAEVTVALATILRGNPTSPRGPEGLRAEVLRQAESLGLPIVEIRSLLEQYRREQDAKRELERLEREALERAAREARECIERETRRKVLTPRKAEMLKRANAGVALDIRRAETSEELDQLEAELLPPPKKEPESLVSSTPGTRTTALPTSVTRRERPSEPLLSEASIEAYIAARTCVLCRRGLGVAGAVVWDRGEWMHEDCYAQQPAY